MTLSKATLTGIVLVFSIVPHITHAQEGVPAIQATHLRVDNYLDFLDSVDPYGGLRWYETYQEAYAADLPILSARRSVSYLQVDLCPPYTCSGVSLLFHQNRFQDYELLVVLESKSTGSALHFSHRSHESRRTLVRIDPGKWRLDLVFEFYGWF